MHPQIVRTEPGNCPICGMELTPVRANEIAPAAAGERKVHHYQSTMMPGEVSDKPTKDSMGMDMVPVYEEAAGGVRIQIDAATVQRMNLKTAEVETGPVRRQIRAVGEVVFDESTRRDVTTKYEGWLEKLFVDTTWAPVKAGEPLFEIYSPELYNAQLNLLVARRAEREPGPLTRAALDRIRLYDVPDPVVSELAASGTARRTFTYRAASDGLVIEKMAVQGQMMRPGEVIFRLADLSHVWVLAQIYEGDLPFVRQGQHAEVRTTNGGDRVFHGEVALLVPQVDAATRTVAARIVVENRDGFLRPGMFADVRFEAQLADTAVLVPDSAVLRSGERNTVFVALPGGQFEPREVELGERTDDYRYEVRRGLAAGERVVTSGQFMLDSESQLREAIEKMLRSMSDSAGSAAAPAPAAQHLH